jgi:hypothetical protein
MISYEKVSPEYVVVCCCTTKSAVGFYNTVRRALYQRTMDHSLLAQQERVSFALVHDTLDLCSSFTIGSTLFSNL